MEETLEKVAVARPAAKRKPAKRRPVKKSPKIEAKTVSEPTEKLSESTEQSPVQVETKPVARFAEKKKRVPVGLRDPMSITEELDPNFSYRFVRNTPGRIQKFEEGGYELVTGDARIGDPNIAKASNMGSAFSIASGDNADRVYLMRIPKDYYDEDQAAKAAKADEIEQQLKQRPKDQGLEGEIKLNR